MTYQGDHAIFWQDIFTRQGWLMWIVKKLNAKLQRAQSISVKQASLLKGSIFWTPFPPRF